MSVFPRTRPNRATRVVLRVFALTVLAAATGCATVPQPLQGEFVQVAPSVANQHDATGQRVRWGGTIASVESVSGQTCFQLVARPLDATARPLASDYAAARFLACRQGFYEPQVFRHGRSLTVPGRVVGYESRKIGDTEIREPKIAADVVYLWPERTVVDVVAGPPVVW